MKSKILVSLLGCIGIAAQASTTTYQVGDLISGSYQPSTSFATLAEATLDNKTFTFTLSAGDLAALFSKGAFIGVMAVDETGRRVLPGISAVNGGVASVTLSKGGGPGGGWDFRTGFGKGSDRLVGNETVTWTETFSAPVDLSRFALHVQGLTDKQGESAWYALSPVPEPGTYAMMLAGLGLIGVMARQRKARQAG